VGTDGAIAQQKHWVRGVACGISVTVCYQLTELAACCLEATGASRWGKVYVCVPMLQCPTRRRYYVNRKPRLSPRVSYDLEAQQRLWNLLTEQTGATFGA
jgi:hypothetical protein